MDAQYAFSNGLSVAFSNAISLFSGIFQRNVTCPVDLTGIVRFSVACSNGISLLCEIWRVIFRPESLHAAPVAGAFPVLARAREAPDRFRA